MDKDLRAFLKALQQMRTHVAEDGATYDCFGCYDWRNVTCVDRSTKKDVCHVCFLSATKHGDWMDAELKKRG